MLMINEGTITDFYNEEKKKKALFYIWKLYIAFVLYEENKIMLNKTIGFSLLAYMF